MAVVGSLTRALQSLRRRSLQSEPPRDKSTSEISNGTLHSTNAAIENGTRPHNKELYEPPSGPPPGRTEELPVRDVELPLIIPFHRHNLSAQGWTTVTLSTPDPTGMEIRDTIQSLFAASKAFFDRDDEYKEQFRTKLGSEDGWSSIPGEKQFITIRTLNQSPEELREAATMAWSKLGHYLNTMLARIAESLDLSPDALTKFSEPCISLSNRRTATMLRLFRYEGWEDKVVAEPHNDLGLLSLVAGNSPGLEVWNGMQKSFYPIEKTYKDLSLESTVLVGRQLQRLTNGRYLPGGHRVKSYPKSGKFFRSNDSGKRFRYSIVFVLRAHDDVIINTKSLTSSITGTPSMVTDGMAMGQLFESIRNTHYNINTGIKARADQKQKIQEQKNLQATATAEDKGDKVNRQDRSEKIREDEAASSGTNRQDPMKDSLLST